MGTNARLNLGWTTGIPSSYNALGTPGQTTIFMASGSFINSRTGGTNKVPRIVMSGPAKYSMSQSTQAGSQPTFGHGILGNYTFSLVGKKDCKAYLTSINSFSELLCTSESGDNYFIYAQCYNSLSGDVTIQASGGVICANLVIDVPDAMADNATLSLFGTARSPTNGAAARRLEMNANDTIARLLIDGVAQPAGT